MRRSGPPRLNRLPQRLDYTLIPAPLDLSLPLVDEKAELPAIIVTPSSPSGETDFSIAFLAPPPKPGLRERVADALPSMPKMRLFHRRLPSEIQLPISPCKEAFISTSSSKWRFKAGARSALLLAILFFIMVCHLIMHGLLTSRPHLDFAELEEETVQLKSWNTEASDVQQSTDSAIPTGSWFGLHSVWSPMAHGHRTRNSHFIITDIGEGVRPT